MVDKDSKDVYGETHPVSDDAGDNGENIRKEIVDKEPNKGDDPEPGASQTEAGALADEDAP